MIVDKRGFTLIEMTVAVFLITTVILGVGASAGYMIKAASRVGLKSESLQSVESRISQIVMDPRYGDLESLYQETEIDLPGLEGFSRVTSITHVKIETEDQEGRFTDYKRVKVSVSGPGLTEGISRSIVVGSP